jgi:alkanesulfonate monooxygenase SsuD/methylene tetrahydromethanopterin reductase-like flavin-dependent oxidoreductase (luciferase family)
VAILDGAAEKAGRDPGNIRRVLNGAAAIAADSPADARGLTGTSGEILETIELYREAGIDTFHLRFPEEGTEEQVQRFAEEIIAKICD